ncbi:MAG: AMP-binding protein [Vibrionaceae bacterium]
MAQRLTFHDFPWRHWCAIAPFRTALVLGNGAYAQKITWQQLIFAVDRLSPFFTDLKNEALQQRAKTSHASPLLSIVLPAQEEPYLLLAAMLAAWQQGIATCLINPNFSTSRKQHISKQAAAVELCAAQWQQLRDFLQDAHVENAPAVRARSALPVSCFSTKQALTLTHTSGSSGEPKIVAHAMSQHLASAAGLLQRLRFTQDDCWLLSLPLFHISGLAIVWRWLSVGAALKLADCSGANLAVALDGATHASLVPTQLQSLLDKNTLPTTLSTVLLGGAQIPQKLVEQAQLHGLACWCGYGMTEMGSTVTVKRADELFSVGVPLPFRKLRLTLRGEVQVRGACLAKGYVRRGVLKPFRGWFATKDRAQRLPNGELVILGRRDEQFICGGENVQPEVVERVLRQCCGVQQVFIVPVAHPRWGQVAAALVQGDVEKEAFFAFAKERLPAFERPHYLWNIPAQLLPINGKMSRQALKQWAALQLA